jgi:hypothetical protein
MKRKLHRKLGKKLKEAIKAYYEHRLKHWKFLDTSLTWDSTKKEFVGLIPNPAYDPSFKWDKQADLRVIEDEALKFNRPKIYHFSASAGSFWFTWVDGSITYHDDTQWWRMETDKHWKKKVGWDK